MSETAEIGVAQLNRNSWLMTVSAAAGVGDDDSYTIHIEPKDDLKPGFYTISGRLNKISG
ncbi:MAG: hypothetical protein O3B84_01505 [Chloroflexi bacterium]|nr:hypothetical protein [Chloroflexota bacterium]